MSEVVYLLDICVEKHSPRLQYEVFDSLRPWHSKWIGPGANIISVCTTGMGTQLILELLAIKDYRIKTLAHAKDGKTEILLVRADSTPAVLNRLKIPSKDDLERRGIDDDAY